MKKIVAIDQEFGGDGGKVAGAFGVEGDQLRAEVAVTYPLEKVVEPACRAVDNLLDKIEAAIPGDWDKPMIEKLKGEYRSELVKLLSE